MAKAPTGLIKVNHGTTAKLIDKLLESVKGIDLQLFNVNRRSSVKSKRKELQQMLDAYEEKAAEFGQAWTSQGSLQWGGGRVRGLQ